VIGVRTVDKKEIGKRLKELRNKRGLFAEKVANDINVSKSTIYMWESGSRTPDIFQLMVLSDYYGIGLDELTGREMKGDINLNHINADMVKIPIVGEVKAGYDLLAEQNIIGYTYTSRSSLNGGQYFSLRVQGDSMKGAGIEENDLVLVRRQPAVDEGQIAVVLIDKTEATIKRVYYGNGEQVILQSENNSYPPRICNFDDIKILGLVKEVKKEVR
jgi:repressor LexA